MEVMSLNVAIGFYHLLGLSCAVLFVSLFCRRPSWAQFLGGGLSFLMAALVLAVMLAAVPFNPLRVARLLCYGWFVHFPLYLLAAACVTKQALLRCAAIVAVVALAVVVWYSFLVEPFRLEVSQYQIRSSKIHSPLKIGVLADFQTDKLEAYEKASLQRLLDEKPDVIVMPGDFLQSETREGWELLRDEMNAFMREIEFSAPQGVFAVGGNTDFRRRWPEIFAGLPVETILDTTVIKTETFAITGLSVEDSFDRSIHVDGPSELFHIVLGHAPDFALSKDADADLLIAGHTHGGQVRIPFIGPLVTFSQVPKSWAAGMTRVDDQRTLVVSRGVGMERRDAPRLRFFCRPQLVIIDVLPTSD